MDNILQLIELGVPVGIGIYIGFEAIKLLIKSISNFCIWILEKVLKEN